MPTIFIRDKMEFDEEHGENFFSNGRYVYENGAQWFSTDPHGGGRGEKPPTGDDLKFLIYEFLSSKLERLKIEYRELESAVQTQSEYCELGCGASPDEQFPDWFETQDGRATVIKALQKKLADLKRKLPKTVKQKNQERYSKKRHEEREQAADARTKLSRLPRF